MPRRKSSKEYAIRLIHPEFGEYYFNYHNLDSDSYYYQSKYSNYVFTKNLSKVNTWKTLEVVEKEISTIISELNNKKSKIVLPFGSQVDKELESKLILSRKKYYAYVTQGRSKKLTEDARNNTIQLNESLINDSKLITKMIKSNKHIEKNFVEILNKIEKNVNLYKKNYKILEEDKSNNIHEVYLDVVDASYGFRLLKLKTLKKVQNQEEI